MTAVTNADARGVREVLTIRRPENSTNVLIMQAGGAGGEERDRSTPPPPTTSPHTSQRGKGVNGFTMHRRQPVGARHSGGVVRRGLSPARHGRPGRQA